MEERLIECDGCGEAYPESMWKSYIKRVVTNEGTYHYCMSRQSCEDHVIQTALKEDLTMDIEDLKILDPGKWERERPLRKKAEKVDDDEIKLYWGSIDDREPNLIVDYGQNCSEALARKIMFSFYERVYDPKTKMFRRSIIDEMIADGMDISTLTFTIKRRNK